MLEVKDLEAKIVETGQQILNGVSLTVRQGEVHAIMGKNGSGKSTLSKVLVGHPDYEVTGGTATYKGKNLFDLEPEERSHEGLFLSFQSPIEIPGVSNVDFLRMACNARRKALGQTELDPLEFYAHVIPKVRPAGVQGRHRTHLDAYCCRAPHKPLQRPPPPAAAAAAARVAVACMCSPARWLCQHYSRVVPVSGSHFAAAIVSRHSSSRLRQQRHGLNALHRKQHL
jgi:energy-coupling factor transporter ATP-binding protein EcfA2